MKRAFTLLAGASLLLFVVTAFLWARSDLQYSNWLLLTLPLPLVWTATRVWQLLRARASRPSAGDLGLGESRQNDDGTTTYRTRTGGTIKGNIRVRQR